MKYKISIITVNYNQSDLTNELIRSIQLGNFCNYEIIVVDNNSQTEDVSKINTDFPNVKLICSSRNLGFAKGNNLGLRYATGEFILFINNDTEIHANTIPALLEAFRQYPEAGAISPLIKYHSETDAIQYAGYTKMNPYTQRMFAIGKNARSSAYEDSVKETAAVHGCAVMTKRENIEKVGDMPTPYFLYYEELEWSEQFKRKGFKLYVQPAAIVYHKESVSTGKDSTLQTYFKNRNRLLFLKRNYSGIQKLVGLIYLLLFAFPSKIIKHLLSREFQHTKALVRALLWHLSPFKSNSKYYVNI